MPIKTQESAITSLYEKADGVPAYRNAQGQERLFAGSGGGIPTDITSATLDVGGADYNRTVELKADTIASLEKADSAVQDPNYTHTDNNFTNAAVTKIAEIDDKLSDVQHDDTTLTGNGTTDDPLSVAPVEFDDTESENLPPITPETYAQKLQEIYSLCKWFKTNMLVPIGWWPRMVLAFMQSTNGETIGDKIAALNVDTGFAIEPLTNADRGGWTVTLDNSAQGGEGAEGVLRLVYTDDTNWLVEGRAWHEGNFHNVLQYSANSPGYELVDGFDGNGGVISAISGDIANSSIAKVLYPESEFTVDFDLLVNGLAANTISNNILRGINTFLYPPQVPTPYNAADATNKAYVDAAIAAALGN